MKTEPTPVNKPASARIAVIGMGCCFPGASNPEAYWDLLQQGKNAVRLVPEDRWDWKTYYDKDPETPGRTYSRWGGFIDKVYEFDPLFFNISPREAMVMDPQQRIMLEVAWQTMENAGYTTEKLGHHKTGVFIGCSNNGYYQHIRQGLKHTDYSAGIGNQNAIIANRISYFLDLHGPSIMVDTMCSSSLVSIHMACQSIRRGECEMAFAGGVNLLFSPEYYVAMSRMKAHSADGRCKAFDDSANGIVLGEGAGAVLLKSLDDALKDGDIIHGVIMSSVVNHGGETNGLTAPNPSVQTQLVEQAIEEAGISAEEISYVEAHGTGTPLGDPIEIRGLTQAFRKYTGKNQFCYIGSSKTNIGHLESAAGIAQIIKVILSMQHRQLPASLHFNNPNRFIDFENSPFKVNTALIKWESTGTRRSGISSFGMGGTNAHVIIEEAPYFPYLVFEKKRPLNLFTFSARSAEGLDELAGRYREFIGKNRDVFIDNICFTAHVGREHYADRAALIIDSTDDLKEKLDEFKKNKLSNKIFRGGHSMNSHYKIAFLFTGQGSQYNGMTKELYQTQPFFRKIIDYCDKIVSQHFPESLKDILYSEACVDTIDQTAYTHVAIFVTEYALAKLWLSWGVRPEVLIGHSLGEYVAACIGGVFSLEDALKLVITRGKLIQSLPNNGGMLCVFETEDLVAKIIAPYGNHISIAVINGRRNTVISGEEIALNEIEELLAAKEIRTSRLNVSHAFHSRLMKPILRQFEEAAKAIAYFPPQIKILSNITGNVITEEIASCHYWSKHITAKVNFAKSMETSAGLGCNTFLEVGPTPVLTALGKEILRGDDHLWVYSLRRGTFDWSQMLSSLAKLYVRGIPVNWKGFNDGYEVKTISLPTYPFQRQEYYLTPDMTINSPILGNRIKGISHFPDTYVWESEVDNLSYAAYVEMAITAAKEITGEKKVGIRNMELHQTLLIPKNVQLKVQTVISIKKDKGMECLIYSLFPERKAIAEQWVLCASAGVVAEH